MARRFAKAVLVVAVTVAVVGRQHPPQLSHRRHQRQQLFCSAGKPNASLSFENQVIALQQRGHTCEDEGHATCPRVLAFIHSLSVYAAYEEEFRHHPSHHGRELLLPPQQQQQRRRRRQQQTGNVSTKIAATASQRPKVRSSRTNFELFVCSFVRSSVCDAAMRSCLVFGSPFVRTNQRTPFVSDNQVNCGALMAAGASVPTRRGTRIFPTFATAATSHDNATAERVKDKDTAAAATSAGVRRLRERFPGAAAAAAAANRATDGNNHSRLRSVRKRHHTYASSHTHADAFRLFVRSLAHPPH